MTISRIFCQWFQKRRKWSVPSPKSTFSHSLTTTSRPRRLLWHAKRYCWLEKQFSVSNHHTQVGILDRNVYAILKWCILIISCLSYATWITRSRSVVRCTGGIPRKCTHIGDSSSVYIPCHGLYKLFWNRMWFIERPGTGTDRGTEITIEITNSLYVVHKCRFWPTFHWPYLGILWSNGGMYASQRFNFKRSEGIVPKCRQNIPIRTWNMK